METFFSAIESIAVLAAGLAVRAGILLAVLAVLSIPVMLFLGGVRGVDAVRRRLLGVMRLDGFSWSDQAFYAPGHTWVRRTGRSRVVVGVDDLVQRLFPTPSGVQLPKPGTLVRANEPMAEVRTMGRRATLMAPVTGIVTAVNRAVTEDPSLFHRDPYARGWLLSITPSDRGFETLPRGEQARTWLRNEGNRLSRFFEVQLGVAAADGGEFITPPPTMLSDDQWTTLTREFLANDGARG
jgi:glycine cleavage system H lipoate-binding protein